MGRVEGTSWRSGRDQGDLLGPLPTGGMEANGTGLGGRADDGDDDLAPRRGPHVVTRGGWRGRWTRSGNRGRIGTKSHLRAGKARQDTQSSVPPGRTLMGWRYYSSCQQSAACGGEAPHLRG